MPGHDGSGPMGMGPMTGGARGRCNPNSRFLKGQTAALKSELDAIDDRLQSLQSEKE